MNNLYIPNKGVNKGDAQRTTSYSHAWRRGRAGWHTHVKSPAEEEVRRHDVTRCDSSSVSSRLLSGSPMARTSLRAASARGSSGQRSG